MQSLKKKQDFKKVYSQGKYAADTLFVAYALANGLSYNRIGITVSKKIGSAVIRNRVRRWVKESYRKIFCTKNIFDAKMGQAPQFCDFVFIARIPSGQLIGKGAYNQVYTSIRRLFERVSKKVDHKK